MAHRQLSARAAERDQASAVPEDLARHTIAWSNTELAIAHHLELHGGPGRAVSRGHDALVQSKATGNTTAARLMRFFLSVALACMGIAISPQWLFDEELAKRRGAAAAADWEPFRLPNHLVSPQQAPGIPAKVKCRWPEHVRPGRCGPSEL